MQDMKHRAAPADNDSEGDQGDDVELLRRSANFSGMKGDIKDRQSATSSRGRRCAIIGGVLFAAGLLAHGLLAEWTDAGQVIAVTWNIAAINNNPFEYWITHDDADYNKLMVDVQEFISSPGARDVPVGDVFTAAMWTELKAEMAGRGWSGLDEVEARWTTDFSQRKIISGFMKDKALGEKRLASMPDRLTNTINLANGGVANRPTVINCFDGDMASVASWWKAWKHFMFTHKLELPSGSSNQAAGLLSKIKRSKYPAVTEDEERLSIPLQTLAQAIFDGVLVHIVNSVSPGGKWQSLKREMCTALNTKKDERTLGILAKTYSDATVVFLQESAGVFVKRAEDHPELGDRFFIGKSASLDTKRDQNSILLLRSAFFNEATLKDHTSGVMQGFAGKSVPVANGDLLAMSVSDMMGRKYLLASFHGDTNGLATIPVLEAVHSLAATMPDHALIFGLDANTYTASGNPKLQGVDEFAASFRAKGYSSCWGEMPNSRSPTTFNARTYLQPQLQKAARADEKESKGDKNPKDFILFPKARFEVLEATKDNTGERRYIEDMVFPTLKFPSDHGVVAAKLKIKD
jgi:hypothetical protein